MTDKIERTVYSYWKCSSCDTINRGDVKICSCGSRIPNNVKYLMPDNPIVIKAIKSGKVNVENKTVDQNGIIADIVPIQGKGKPNWKCQFCGFQNSYEDDNCIGCGSGRSQIDYFDSEVKGRVCEHCGTALDDEDVCPNCGYNLHYTESSNTQSNDTINSSFSSNSDIKTKPSKNKINWKNITKMFSFNLSKLKYIFITLLGLGIIGFLVWLFIPITRVSTVIGFSWERSINIEQYKTCYEDDWFLPSNARLDHTEWEIHYYTPEFDHYETRTRTYTVTKPDGFDVSYIDNGNGTAQRVETPRYKTEVITETYPEPVYIDKPVYQTKYYFYIDRWKIVDVKRTQENDHNPYWPVIDLPNNVYNPVVGDKKLGARIEKYYVQVLDDNEEIRYIPLEYSEWIEFSDKTIEYKTFRFSHKPLGGK